MQQRGVADARHFRDGPVVAVHRWMFLDGGTVGCENAAHKYALG